MIGDKVGGLFSAGGLTPTQTAYLLVALGAGLIVTAAAAFRSGRIDAEYRKWGCACPAEVDGSIDPLQFLVRVLLNLLLGVVLVTVGIVLLLRP